MTWADTAVLGILAVSAFLAFLRGLVREVLGIAAWVGAGIVAWWAMPSLLPYASRWISDHTMAQVAAFAAAFVVAAIFLSIIAGMVGNIVRMSALGGFDRTLGLLFGLARGGVLVAAAYILLGMVRPPEQWPAPLLDSRSLPYAYEGAAWLASLLPPQYRPVVHPLPAEPQTRADDLLQPQPQGRAIGQP